MQDAMRLGDEVIRVTNFKIRKGGNERDEGEEHGKEGRLGGKELGERLQE